MSFNKRGFHLSNEVIIGIVLALAFFVIVISLYKPLTSPKFYLNLKEHTCRYSIVLSQSPLKFPVLCHTELITFSKKNIEKDLKRDESTKDAAMRQILDYMLKCKTMVDGPKRKGFTSDNSCYICYSLHTDTTTPFITEEELATYSFRHKTSTGNSYFYELNERNHWPTVFLNGGLGTKPQATQPSNKALSLGNDYAITYVSVNEGSVLQTLGIGAAGVAGCALAGATFFIPYVGPIIAVTRTPNICKFSIATASGIALFNILKPSEEGKGMLLFTNYDYLEQTGCNDVVS